MTANRSVVNALCYIPAHFLSILAFEILTFAITVHVYELTGDAIDVGLFAALAFLPRPAAPWFGWITDHFPPRSVFAGALLVAGAAALSVSSGVDRTGLMIAWTVMSAMSVIALNVRNAILPQAMPTEGDARDNAWVLASLNVARLAAPMIGALVVSLGATRFVPALGAAALSLAALSILPLRLTNGPASRRTGDAEDKELIGRVWRHPDLRLVVRVSVIWRLFAGFELSALVVLASRGLGGGGVEFGLLTAVAGLGGLAGGLLGPAVVRRSSPRVVALGGTAAHFVLLGILGATRDTTVALCVCGAAFACVHAAAVSAHVIRDRTIPAITRGRILGRVTALTAAPALLSMAAGGWAIERFGVEATFTAAAVAGTIALIAPAWGAFTRARTRAA